MKFLDLKPKIFDEFPEIKSFFAVGQFNFSLSDKATVIKERQILLEKLNLRRNQLATLSQIASNKLLLLSSGQKIDFLSDDIPEADGMYTAEPDIFLGIRAADCLPILFYNKIAGIVGAVHAGWEGTAKLILKKTVQAISEKFDARAKDFYFYFGPAAQVCHYEITNKLERAEKFKNYAGALVERDGKLFLDFVKANRLELEELGIDESQIEDSGICTIHNEEYPSHRRQGKDRKETMLSLIGSSPGSNSRTNSV